MAVKKTVLVAMSGGVDSSTTAAILKEQGYDVQGLTMVLSDEIDTDSVLASARGVADLLGIELHVSDFRHHFRNEVIEYFIQSYESGLTPNPCVICNQHIKFGRLLKKAESFGADLLATGHYVRLVEENQRRKLLKGIDATKDQSYFLYRLQQKQLKHLLFPLGNATKTQVREMAAGFGLPVADKTESQDLCFIAKGDYRDFLQTHSTVQEEPGPIVTKEGEILGTHKGLWNYTIGQRRGLGVAFSEPLYVVRLDVAANRLVVAVDKDRGTDRFTVHQVTFVQGDPPESRFEASVKIRYTAQEVPAVITLLPENRAEISIDRSLPDITPGQSAVFYRAEELLGGGFIE